MHGFNLSRNLQERQIGQLPQAAVMRLNDFLDQRLTSLANPRLLHARSTGMNRRYGSTSSQRSKRAQWGSIAQFDRQCLYARLLEKGLSARTIAGVATSLQSAMGQGCALEAAGRKSVGGHPTSLPAAHRVEGPRFEECWRFLDVARQTDWYALFDLALTTGMRPCEYPALRWGDIDWSRGAASVGRTIQLTKER